MSAEPGMGGWRSLPRRLTRGRGESALWALGFGLLAIACVALYLASGQKLRPWPGSTVGVGFGIAATVLFVAAALYGLRRRVMRWATRWHLGRTRSWLYLHLYGGIFFLLLVSLHTAFKGPTGLFSWLLWILSWWTVLTGIGGLALQRWIPRVLASLSVEANAARIPQMVSEIRQRVETLVNASGEPVRKLAVRRIDPVLKGPRRSWLFFIDASPASSNLPLDELDYLQRLSGGEEGERLQQVKELMQVKHELDVHYTLQNALRVWLVIHLPASWLLLAAIVVHILAVLYY